MTHHMNESLSDGETDLQTDEQNKSGVFTQQHSPVTGSVEWVLRDSDYDFYQEIARSDYGDMLHDIDRNKLYEAGLRATITHLKRVAESEGVRVLDIGTGSGLLSMMAARILQRIKQSEPKSDQKDRENRDSIVACEAFDPIAKLAREIVSANGFDSLIRIVGKRSTQLTVDDISNSSAGTKEQQKAVVCVAEVFDTELIGEGALSTFRHAVENLLVPGSFTVPARAHVYALPVRSPYLSHFGQFRDLNLQKNANERVTIAAPAGAADCAGGTLLYDLQLSELEPYVHFEPLCDPLLVYTFDFNNAESMPFDEVVTHRFRIDSTRIRDAYLARLSDTERSRLLTKSSVLGANEKTATATATVDCILFWWTTPMVDDRVVESLQLDVKDYTITCAPTWVPRLFADMPQHSIRPAWRDHWLSAVYFPRSRVTIPSLHQELELVASHDECSFWFDVRAVTGGVGDSCAYQRSPVGKATRAEFEKSKPFCSCSAHNGFAKQRVAFVNNLDNWWTDAVKLIDRHADRLIAASAHDAVPAAVVISDGSPLGVMVSKSLPNFRIFQLDRGHLTQRIAHGYSQSNDLRADGWSLAMTVAEIAEKIRNSNSSVRAVFAEPFFSFGVLPWHSLYLGYAIHQLFSSLNLSYPGVSASAPFMAPRSASLCAVLVQFENLHKTRAAIENCENFDLSAFERAMQGAQQKTLECGAAESHALYEYPGSLLSRSVCLRRFRFDNSADWEDSRSDLVFERVRFEIKADSAGELNGIALWMEYEMDDDWRYSTGLLPDAFDAVAGNSSKWIDKWNVCNKQAVVIFRKPRVIHVPSNGAAYCECTFRLKIATGDLICESMQVV